MAKLFKDKIIKQKLESFKIENFEQKLEVIQKWHKDYHNGTLKTDNEISRAPDWTRDFLRDILDYTSKPDENYTYEIEPTIAGQRPDFILGHFTSAKGYIIGELKATKISLDAPQKGHGSITPVQQAFKYKGNVRDSSFVIVSNFFETRLYYDNYLDYEMWNLDTLVNPKNDYYQLRKFIYLLTEKNLIAKRGESQTKGLISFIQTKQKEITKKFYDEYKGLRLELLRDLYLRNESVRQNIDFGIEKGQKIIDRIIFACFCEDKDLLPDNILQTVIQKSEESFTTLWLNLQGFFQSVDKGNPSLNIPEYNGGLFKGDTELNQLNVSDEILSKLLSLGRYNFEEDLSVNILGHIFEQSITDLEEIKDKVKKKQGIEDIVKVSKRKKDGVFYTPDYIVDYIVKNSVGKKIEDWEQELKEKHNLKDDINDKNYTKRAILVYTELQEKLQNITVLDPACGSGAFLVKVFDFLLDKNKEVSKILEELTGTIQMKDEQYFRTILKNNIYGVDLNEESVEITKLSLWLKTAIKGRKLANLDANIKCGNSLIDDPAIAGDKAFSWETEFPQIFADGGFDVIVGNPPYVRQELINKEDKKYLASTYETGNGTADLYVYFYERAIELLKNKGMLAFITPNKFYKTKYGLLLRKYLKNYDIVNLIDFFELNIFEDASTDSQILVLEKSKNAKIFNYSPIKTIDDFRNINYEILKIDKNSLENSGWVFIAGIKKDLFNKLHYNSITLREYTKNGIEYGVKTGFNAAFIIDEDTKNKIIQADKCSKELIKPYISPTNILRYSLNYKNEYIITTFPAKRININNFKGVRDYLERFGISRLEQSGLSGARKKTSGKWFETQDTISYFEKFEKNKILYIHTAVDHKFYYDEEKYYINNSCYMISNADKFLSLWLNSKIFKFYKKIKFVSYGDSSESGRAKLDYNKMVNVPIPNISNDLKKPFIEKADFMLKHNKIMGEKVKKFLSRVQGTFELEKVSKKLQAFYELTFEEFLKELKKKKVVLSLKDQDEWQDYFNGYKVEVSEIKAEIDACDREIDEMVFDLYGLSEEERGVVINS